VNDLRPLPTGFKVGHWTDVEARTGCTVVIAPGGTRGAVEVRGGGTGTRELEALSPLANAEGPTAVLLTGGSAFGLAAADGVVHWLERGGLGRPTPVGVIPLVPAAVVFDLADGGGGRPGPEQGYAACEAATGGVPGRGRIGAGAGTAVGKVLGRKRATKAGIGYAGMQLAGGETVAAIAVANAAGDVIAEDGEVLGGPRGDQGQLLRSAELMRDMPQLPDWAVRPGQSTTLACICTDASLDKRGCGIVARTAAAGIARAVDPAFTPLDGDVVFCLASGPWPPAEPGADNSWSLTVLGTTAATLTADAIRDAVRHAGRTA
jgi:L-aminopeptidase/D-esterase-like protein